MQFSEEEVREALQPYHDRICEVIERAYSEWVKTKRARTNMGFDAVLYSRTAANFIFDAVARNALREFGSDERVRVLNDPQTIKICFEDVVVARFKKGDEDHLGQNHPTQAVMDFLSPQAELPGLPPSAAKVEILYAADEVVDQISSVVVAARDGDELLWHYRIETRASDSRIVHLPHPSDLGPQHDHDTDGLISPRRIGDVRKSEN